MLKSFLATQRPQAQELLMTLDRNPELAADATAKVRHALVRLRSNSSFIKFAVSRFLRAVRVIQLFVKRCVAGFRSMRQRALFEWSKRGDSMPSDVLLHRLPTEAVRCEVIAQEFATQRAAHRAARKVWRKGEIHLENRRAEIESEIAELVSRPSGYSAAAFRTLQERLAYVSGRLAHHRAMAPQFRGMEVVLKNLNDAVATAMHTESSSRVQSAMKSIGLESEDAKFFDAVVKKYEFLVEEEFAKRRLAKLVSGVRSGSILRGHRASVLLTSGSAPAIPKPGPVTTPTAAAVRTPRNGSKVTITLRRASVEDSQAASKGSDRGQWDDTLPSPRSGMGDQQHLLTSVLTPKHLRKFDATAASSTNTMDDHASATGDVTANGTAAPSRIDACTREGPRVPPQETAEETTPSDGSYAITETAARCYAALGISLDDLKQPVEDVHNKKFSAELFDAMQWSGLTQTTALVQAPATSESQDRGAAGVIGADKLVLSAPLTGTSSPTRRKNHVVIKEFPRPPASPRPCSARDFTKLRLENRSSKLRKELSPSRRRRLRLTIGGEGSPSDAPLPVVPEAVDGESPQREGATSHTAAPRVDSAAGTDGRRRRCLSPKKAPTDSNLAALRQAAREKRQAQLARKAPFLPLPPPIRLEDMRIPSPPLTVVADEGHCAPPPLPASGTAAVPLVRANSHWSPVPTEHEVLGESLNRRRASAEVTGVAAAATVAPGAALAATATPVTTPRQPDKLAAHQQQKDLRTAPTSTIAPAVAAAAPALVASCGSVSMNSAGQIFVHGCPPKQYSRDHQLDGFVHDTPHPAPRKLSAPVDAAAVVVTSALPSLSRPVTSLLWMPAPSERDPCGGYVAAGCSDGSLRIFAASFATGSYVEVYSSGDIGATARDSLLHLCQCDQFLCGAVDNDVTVVTCSRVTAPATSAAAAAGIDSGARHGASPRQRGNHAVPHAAASNGPPKVNRGTMEFKGMRKIRANASITWLLPVPAEFVGKKHPSALLLVTTFDSVVELFDVATSTVYLRLDGHVQSVERAFISRTTKKIVTSSHDCTVKLWVVVEEEHSGALAKAASGASTVAGAANPSQPSGSNRGGAAFPWDTSSPTRAPNLGAPAADSEGPIVAVSTFTQHHAAVLCCMDVTGPQTIASISRDNTIRIWDQITLESYCVISHIPGHLFLGCASSISSAVATFAFSDGTVRCYSTETGKLLQCTEVRGAQVCHSVGPNHIAVGSGTGTLAVVSVDSGRIVAVSEALHYSGIRALAAVARDSSTSSSTGVVTDADDPLHLLVGGEDRRTSMIRVVPQQNHARALSFRKNATNLRESTPPPVL